MTGGGRRGWPAFGLLALAVAEGLLAVVGAVATGLGLAAVVDSFLVPNLVIGLGCAVCGVLIAWQRPDNALGWLLLGAGVTQPATAAVTPWLVQALQTGAPDAQVRALATVYSAAWPWSAALFIPLVLLCFPDGRLLPGRWWRGVASVLVGNAVLQVLLFNSGAPLEQVEDLRPQEAGRAPSWLAVPGLDLEGPVATAWTRCWPAVTWPVWSGWGCATAAATSGSAGSCSGCCWRPRCRRW